MSFSARAGSYIGIEHHVKKDEQDMFAVFPVLEGPACLENIRIPSHSRRFSIGIEFKGGVAFKNSFEKKESLLVGYLIRKCDGIGDRDIHIAVLAEEGVKELGIVLKKSFFDVLCGCR